MFEGSLCYSQFWPEFYIKDPSQKKKIKINDFNRYLHTCQGQVWPKALGSLVNGTRSTDTLFAARVMFGKVSKGLVPWFWEAYDQGLKPNISPCKVVVKSSVHRDVKCLYCARMYLEKKKKTNLGTLSSLFLCNVLMNFTGLYSVSSFEWYIRAMILINWLAQAISPCIPPGLSFCLTLSFSSLVLFLRVPA